MIFLIYYSSVISRLLLKFVYSREIKKRAIKEGYVFKKKKEFLTKKLTRFIKGCLLTFVPAVNTLSVVSYLAKGLEGAYEEAITSGVSNGRYVKASEPAVEEKSIFDRIIDIVDNISNGIKKSAGKCVDKAENYIEKKASERTAQNKPVDSVPVRSSAVKSNPAVSQPVRSSNSRIDNLVNETNNGKSKITSDGTIISKPVASAPVRSTAVQSKPVVSARVQSTSVQSRPVVSARVQSKPSNNNAKSYESMNIQEKLAHLEAERLRAKSLQRNSDDFSRKL